MRLLKKVFVLTVAAGVFFPGFQRFSSAAAVQMSALIGFVNPLSVSNRSDVRFGGIHPEPHDQVVMDTTGKIKITGTGTVESADGQPGSISITDSNDQSVNFLPGNYRYGGSVGALKAICALNGNHADEKDCALLPPVTGMNKKTLDIGMDMTMAGAAASSQSVPSSFDISAVYQ